MKIAKRFCWSKDYFKPPNASYQVYSSDNNAQAETYTKHSTRSAKNKDRLPTQTLNMAQDGIYGQKM